jgi:hypothetical protein
VDLFMPLEISSGFFIACYIGVAYSLRLWMISQGVSRKLEPTFIRSSSGFLCVSNQLACGSEL